MGRGVSAVTGWLAAAALVVGCGGLGPEAVQGPVVPTGRGTDLALLGPGLFQVSDGVRTEYTRKGDFALDADGYLVDAEGWHLQGTLADADGRLLERTGSLLVGRAVALPRATRTVTIRGNLAADAPLNSAPGFQPEDPCNTSNFRTSVRVLDSLGSSHVLDVYYRKTGPGLWELHVLADGAGLVGATPGLPVELASGLLAFSAEGLLSEVGLEVRPLDAVGAEPAQLLTFDLGDPLRAGGTGARGLSQFGGTSGVSTTTFIGQDGRAPSALASLRIDAQGQVLGRFEDGTGRLLGQVGVALVPNPSALVHTCGASYAATAASGQPVLGPPASGGRAILGPGSLESLTYPSEPCSGR